MQYHLFVVKDSEGGLNVFVDSGNVENTKKEMAEQGEEVIASYPLAEELLALGILVSDSLNSSLDSSFGSQFEKLMTTLVRDVLKVAKR